MDMGGTSGHQGKDSRSLVPQTYPPSPLSGASLLKLPSKKPE